MLKFSSVTKFFKNQAVLLSANMTIQEKRVNILSGANGCGKTTTVKLLTGLLKLSKYDSGIIENTMRIAYLPEKVYFPELMKTKEYLKEIAIIKNTDKNYIELMKLWQIPNQFIYSLSKGMKQKLGILQIILSPADCYIFDEPTDGLDIASIQLFISTLKDLLDFGKTIVIITHQKKFFRELKPCYFNFRGQKIYET